MPFLAHCTYFCQHIFFFFFLFTLIKSTQKNSLRFFPNKFINILKNHNFRLQGLQIEAFQQPYSKCQCETPYFESEFIPKTCKNWKIIKKKFPKWFGPKQIEAIRFRNGFHDKSAETDCSKEMWIPILKRLKHLKLVITTNHI